MTHDDEGFVLIDALIAAVILGVVGTAALSLSITLTMRGDRLLDRSQFLVNVEALARQVTAVGANALEILPIGSDGTYIYSVSRPSNTPDPTYGNFVPVRIEASEVDQRDVLQHIDILVAASGLSK